MSNFPLCKGANKVSLDSQISLKYSNIKLTTRGVNQDFYLIKDQSLNTHFCSESETFEQRVNYQDYE